MLHTFRRYKKINPLKIFLKMSLTKIYTAIFLHMKFSRQVQRNSFKPDISLKVCMLLHAVEYFNFYLLCSLLTNTMVIKAEHEIDINLSFSRL